MYWTYIFIVIGKYRDNVNIQNKTSFIDICSFFPKTFKEVFDWTNRTLRTFANTLCSHDRFSPYLHDKVPVCLPCRTCNLLYDWLLLLIPSNGLWQPTPFFLRIIYNNSIWYVSEVDIFFKFCLCIWKIILKKWQHKNVTINIKLTCTLNCYFF